MRTTVDELKALYVKMGGSLEDVEHLQTDAELIDKIEDIAGQKELPTVTTDDNGKILEVVDGAWAKADIPAELPSVTASDNGKVLGVADGAWGVVNVPSDVLIVKCSTTQILDEVTTTDANVTFQDFATLNDACLAIQNALTANKYVILCLSGGSSAQNLATYKLFAPIVGEVAPNMNFHKFEALHYSNVASKLMRYVIDVHTYMGSSAKLTIAEIA